MDVAMQFGSTGKLFDIPAEREYITKLSSIIWQSYILGMAVEGDVSRARGFPRIPAQRAHEVHHAFNRLVDALETPLASVTALVPQLTARWPVVKHCHPEGNVYEGPEEDTGLTRLKCIRELTLAVGIWRDSCYLSAPRIALSLLGDDAYKVRQIEDLRERVAFNEIVSVAASERWNFLAADLYLISEQNVEIYGPWQHAEDELWQTQMCGRAALEIQQASVWNAICKGAAVSWLRHSILRLVVQEELQRVAICIDQHAVHQSLVELEVEAKVTLEYSLLPWTPAVEEVEETIADILEEEEDESKITDPAQEAQYLELSQLVNQKRESLFLPSPDAHCAPLQDRSALIVQKVYRGWRVRCAIKSLKDNSRMYYRMCATHIQAVWRGRCARYLCRMMRIIAAECEARDNILKEEDPLAKALLASENAGYAAALKREAAHLSRLEVIRRAIAACHADQNMGRVLLWQDEEAQWQELKNFFVGGAKELRRQRAERNEAERQELRVEEWNTRKELVLRDIGVRMEWAYRCKHLMGSFGLCQGLGTMLSMVQGIEASTRCAIAMEEDAALDPLLLFHDIGLLQWYESKARRRIFAKEASFRNELEQVDEDAKATDEQRCVASCLIQRVWRGSQGRQVAKKRKFDKEAAELAQHLQRVGRGWMLRRTLAAVGYCQRREKAQRRLLQAEEAAERGWIVLDWRSVQYHAAVRLQCAWRIYIAKRQLARLREFRDELSIVIRAERIERQWLLLQCDKGCNALWEEQARNKVDIETALVTIAQLRREREEYLLRIDEDERQRHAVSVIRNFSGICSRKHALQQRRLLWQQKAEEEGEFCRKLGAQKIWSLWKLYRFKCDLKPALDVLREDRRILRQVQEQKRRALRQTEMAMRGRLHEWLEVMTGQLPFDDLTSMERVQNVDFAGMQLEEDLAWKQLMAWKAAEREQLRQAGKDYVVDAAFWHHYLRDKAAGRIGAFRRAVVERRKAELLYAELQEQHFVIRQEVRARTALLREEQAARDHLVMPTTLPQVCRFSMKNHPLQAISQSVQQVAEAVRPPPFDADRRKQKARNQAEVMAASVGSGVKFLATQLQGARNDFYTSALSLHGAPTTVRKGRILPALPAARAWESPPVVSEAETPAARHGLLPSLAEARKVAGNHLACTSPAAKGNVTSTLQTPDATRAKFWMTM